MSLSLLQFFFFCMETHPLQLGLMFTYGCRGHQCVQTHKSFPVVLLWLSLCRLSHRWPGENHGHAFYHGIFTLQVGVGQYDTGCSSPNLIYTVWLLPVQRLLLPTTWGNGPGTASWTVLWATRTGLNPSSAGPFSPSGAAATSPSQALFI